MKPPDETKRMPWRPDPDTAIRIGWTVAALGFLVAILSAIGEIRGWWGLIGQLGMIIGGLTGILGTIVTVLYAATEEQADTLLHYNEKHGQKLDDLLGTTESMDQKLDKLDKLDGIEAAIVGDDGMIRELDAVQLELDMQTGVLDEQLTVLREIREAL